MAASNPLQELQQLISATREQLTYLQELGGETIETAGTQPSVDWPSPSVSARAAFLESVAAEPKPSEGRPPGGLFADLAPEVPTLTPSTETFEAIWAEVGDCTRCPLHAGRTNVVHTEGNRKARLMFIGEAPGADEDLQARPFVGKAGQLLTKIIESIGFRREEVMIGNVNRCRPPGNRPPTTEEAATCKPFLLREIAIVQPAVIVVLGNTAIKNLLETKEGVSKLRGNFQDYKGIKVMPTFHPAYLLRDPAKKRETWEDLKKVRDYLDQNPAR